MNPRPHDEKWRTRTRRALERYLDRRSAPRLILSVLLILTGTAGLLISVLLLHAGLEAMSIRYPIAVLTGYGVFLLLLRFWVEFERARFNPESGEIDADLEMTEPNESSWANRPRSGSWLDSLDWLDFSDGFDLEGCIPALLIGIFLALVGLFFFAIFSAFALIAEVFLDAFIITVLYRHLRVAAQEHWLGTAVRKTWWPALLTAALLGVAGWGLQALAPSAHSIGPALEQIFGPQNWPQP
ncbi:MAG: hypothetical protein M3480_02755 [Verrucomicrobiota bacterium]|nr:hypothetical protein [Chthoniobacterales bacterium]MDQ3413889.1 hypothetical protein [Verrucomicrobiota bacterium]